MTDDIFLFGYQEDGQAKLGLQKNDNLYALDPKKIPSFDWLMQI